MIKFTIIKDVISSYAVVCLPWRLLRALWLPRKKNLYTADFFATWWFDRVSEPTALHSCHLALQARPAVNHKSQHVVSTCLVSGYLMWCASNEVLSEFAVGAAVSNYGVFSSQLSASIRLQQLLTAASNCCVSCLHSAISACSQPAAWDCSSFKFSWLYACGAEHASVCQYSWNSTEASAPWCFIYL